MRPAAILIWFICSQSYAVDMTPQYRQVQETVTPQKQKAEGYVFDITVNNIEQLDALLNRADELRSEFQPDQYGRIKLVLHGLELNMFRKKNYSKYMDTVDKARKLDSLNLIDIKACQTVMKNLQIKQTELPDFIEQIPLAPVEIERLIKQQGYTRL